MCTVNSVNIDIYIFYDNRYKLDNLYHCDFINYIYYLNNLKYFIYPSTFFKILKSCFREL